MDKLEKLMSALTDYELGVLKDWFEIPENKEKAEKETPEELAYDIVLSLSWHYKGVDSDDLPKGYNGAERREFLWKKAKELGLEGK